MEFKTEEQKIELFTQCITGKLNSSEYKEVYDFIHQNPKDKDLYDALYLTWLSTGLNRPIDKEIEYNVWETISENRNIFKNKYRILKISAKVAAAVLILISVGLNVGEFFRKGEKPGKLMIVEAPKGAKSIVTLADGTQVILNSGSTIKYSDSYNKTARDIFLSGEAYFEVAKNKALPFKVHAGNIIIRALGTVFNVKAYPEEKKIETTLVEGLVSVENIQAAANDKLVYLKPNQQAVYYKTKAEIKIDSSTQLSELASDPVNPKIEPKMPGKIVLNQAVAANIFTSWKDKRLVFKGERFGDFALRLERLYDTRIVVADPEITKYKITGSIEQENLEMVLKALQLIVPIDYKFSNKLVTIYANKKLKNTFDQSLTK